MVYSPVVSQELGQTISMEARQEAKHSMELLRLWLTPGDKQEENKA